MAGLLIQYLVALGLACCFSAALFWYSFRRWGSVRDHATNKAARFCAVCAGVFVVCAGTLLAATDWDHVEYCNDPVNDCVVFSTITPLVATVCGALAVVAAVRSWLLYAER